MGWKKCPKLKFGQNEKGNVRLKSFSRKKVLKFFKTNFSLDLDCLKPSFYLSNCKMFCIPTNCKCITMKTSKTYGNKFFTKDCVVPTCFAFKLPNNLKLIEKPIKIVVKLNN